MALLQHDGIRAIVPLWRNDRGNNGLHDSVKIRFQAFGGRVTAGFRYEPTTTDFSVATNSVASQITNLIGSGTNPSAMPFIWRRSMRPLMYFIQQRRNLRSQTRRGTAATASLFPRH